MATRGACKGIRSGGVCGCGSRGPLRASWILALAAGLLLLPPVAVAQEREQPRVGGSSAELFHQLQLLQVELQELRGMLEEQNHRIDRLERRQREQYMEMDRRLQAFGEQAESGEQAARGSGERQPRGLGETDLVMPESGAAEQRATDPEATETQAYAAAFELAQERRFEEAIEAFEQLLERFPNGQYAANAHYWLGELYLALPEPELDRSQRAFQEVIEVYPSSDKVPDSLYKLGVVYHRKGETSQAREQLERVREEFAGTPAARLAEDYVDELR